MVLTIHSTGEQTSIIKVKPKVRGGTKRIQTVKVIIILLLGTKIPRTAQDSQELSLSSGGFFIYFILGVRKTIV